MRKTLYEYDIVVAAELDKLRDYVNSRLADGWRPQGGVFLPDLHLSGSRRAYGQAIVRKYHIVDSS